MTRIALLSDIHGNATALEAVLTDAAGRGIDEYWSLGDLILPGPGFPRVLGLLSGVNTTVMVRGNWDDCIEDVRTGPVDMDDPGDVCVTVWIDWLLRHLTAAQARDVARWPLAVTRVVNGQTVAAWHNRIDQNYGVSPLAMAACDDLADNCAGADIVAFGHWHEQILRWGRGRHQMVVNPGSVGNAWSTDESHAPAEYAVLRVDDDGMASVDFHRVPYDRRTELDRARDAELPYLEIYEHTLAGMGRLVDAHDALKVIERRDGWRAVAERFLAAR
jgi:predicted phosphodiesterase